MNSSKTSFDGRWQWLDSHAYFPFRELRAKKSVLDHFLPFYILEITNFWRQWHCLQNSVLVSRRGYFTERCPWWWQSRLPWWVILVSRGNDWQWDYLSLQMWQRIYKYTIDDIGIEMTAAVVLFQYEVWAGYNWDLYDCSGSSVSKRSFREVWAGKYYKSRSNDLERSRM